MKKNYSIVCLAQGFMIITAALLFSVTAHSQDDLTPAQIQERCQNNRNRITELEKESKIIAYELSETWANEEIADARYDMLFIKKNKNNNMAGLENQLFIQAKDIMRRHNFDIGQCLWLEKEGTLKCLNELEGRIAKRIETAGKEKLTNKEIEDARDDMSFIRKSKTNNMAGWKEPFFDQVLTTARVYGFDIEECIWPKKKVTLKCMNELEAMISKEIDKAMSLDRPALLAKKNEIDKQISNHRTNLIALGCDEINKNNTEEFIKKLVGGWKGMPTPWGPGGGCQIKYANGKLSLVNEKNDESGASVIVNSDGSAVINASKWPVSGKVDKAAKSIKWSNGSEWER